VPIESYISHESLWPTTRSELIFKTRYCDRRIRREIAEARRRGVWIVGCPTGGYYIANTAAEWNEFVERERRRALATFKRAVSDYQNDGQQMELKANVMD